MRYATSHYLDVVRSYLPPPLVSSQAVSRVQAVAELLPPSSNFGFECRLGSAAPEADFLVAVIPSDGSRSAWLGENPLAVVPPQMRTDPTWAKVRDFFSAWVQKYGNISDAWLEFDLEGTASNVPPPSIFFGSDQDGHQKHPDIALSALRLLLERPLPPAMQERLRACYAALPAESLLFQVGAMLARPTDAIRLCINRIHPEHVVGYLERIDWPGPSKQARQFVAELAPLVDRMGLDFDLSPAGVLPKFSLECALSGKDVGQVRLAMFLAHLVEKGLCLPNKAEALRQWLGYCTDRTDRPRWPAYLLKATHHLGPETMSTFARTLNHIKVTWAPGEPLVAKAYLGVRHFWVRRSER